MERRFAGFCFLAIDIGATGQEQPDRFRIGIGMNRQMERSQSLIIPAVYIVRMAMEKEPEARQIVRIGGGGG